MKFSIRRFFSKQKELNIVPLKPLVSFYELQSYLNQIPSINRGGCGIAALAMYDAAIREGKSPKIVFGYNWLGSDWERNQQFKTGKSDLAESATHICLEMDGKVIDSEGVSSLWDEYCSTFHEATREHLVAAIKYGGWNSEFKRDKWLPQIEAFVGYKLI